MATCEIAACWLFSGVGAPEGVRFRRIQVRARSAAVAGGSWTVVSTGSGSSEKIRLVSVQKPT